jgi:hypothetical protein
VGLWSPEVIPRITFCLLGGSEDGQPDLVVLILDILEAAATGLPVLWTPYAYYVEMLYVEMLSGFHSYSSR